ncbi:MAG: enolase C-terminal domain-like protein, partial [Actinomycetota bacterium]
MSVRSSSWSGSPTATRPLRRIASARWGSRDRPSRSDITGAEPTPGDGITQAPDRHHPARASPSSVTLVPSGFRRRVARATRDLDYFLEQPCKTYEECQQVRRRTDLPMKLDECITGMAAAMRVVQDRGAEVCCLKISNLGGLSKARRVRDFLVDNRIPVVAEDTWGGEIATATLAHFAASTPPEFLINATDLHNYNTRSTGA